MPDGVGQTPAPSTVEAVAALARQLDRLEAKVDGYDVDSLRTHLHGITATVAGLAEELAQLASSGSDDAARSWLHPSEPMTPDDATSLLEQLIRWVARVYLRYGGEALPECWLWHPEVIEELLWLRAAWLAAYLGPQASAQRAGDWHDRQRPGVVRRVQIVAGGCSLREHFDPPAPVVVPAADAAPAMAVWWSNPTTAMPVPTGEQVRAADTAHRATAGWR